jgi:SAM-dependent methyltransferase
MTPPGRPVVRGEACCVCGSTAAVPWREAPDRLLAGTERFTAVLCRTCGTGRLQPRPPASEMGRYYAPGVYARAEDGGELGRRLDAFFARQAARATAASGIVLAQGKRVLDVGCGDGRFLAAMRAHGWSVAGIETDSVAAALAAKRLGAPICETPLETAELPPESFDLVTLLHVLEHVPDPRATLTAAFRLLRPGGALLVAVPNRASVAAAVFGGRWYSLDLPRHLWAFTPRSLARLGGECGFAARSFRYLPFIFLPQNLRAALRPPAPRAASSSSAGGGALYTRVYLALLGLSEFLGRGLPGEVMELSARRPFARTEE